MSRWYLQRNVKKTCNRFQHSDCNSQKITQKKRNFDKQQDHLKCVRIQEQRARSLARLLTSWTSRRLAARFSALMGSFPLHQNQTPDPGTALHIKRHNRTSYIRIKPTHFRQYYCKRSLCWQIYLLQLLRGKLLHSLQLVQTLSVAVVISEEVSGAVLQQEQNQSQTGHPRRGNGHIWYNMIRVRLQKPGETGVRRSQDWPAGSLADGLNRQRVNWASAELCSSSVWQYSIILAQIWETTDTGISETRPKLLW